MKTLLTICLFLAGCSYFEKHEEKTHSSPIEQLQMKQYQIYSEVEAGLDPVTKWPTLRDCDGTLWAGIACAVGMPVGIHFAEYAPGEIHRRPYESCYTDRDNGSKTTISRDMLTGYMACAHRWRDLSAMKRLAEYGEKNNWVMGKPEWYVSRVLLGDNLKGILGRMIYELSFGADDRSYRSTPAIHLPVTEDYQRHIQVQTILLDNAITVPKTMDITGNMLERLRANAEAKPEDPLFQAALGLFTGDQSKALELLMRDEMPCPSYARGENPNVYCKLIWLQAADIVVKSHQSNP